MDCGNETGVDENVGMNTYLHSPCPITCHPLAVESVLAVGIVVDPPGSKIPLPLKYRIVKESLDTFQRITVEERNWFRSFKPFDSDILHLPLRRLRDMVHAGA